MKEKKVNYVFKITFKRSFKASHRGSQVLSYLTQIEAGGNTAFQEGVAKLLYDECLAKGMHLDRTPPVKATDLPYDDRTLWPLEEWE